MVADRIEQRPSGASLAVVGPKTCIVQDLDVIGFKYEVLVPQIGCCVRRTMFERVSLRIYSGKGLRVSICPGGAFPTSDDDEASSHVQRKFCAGYERLENQFTINPFQNLNHNVVRVKLGGVYRTSVRGCGVRVLGCAAWCMLQTHLSASPTASPY